MGQENLPRADIEFNEPYIVGKELYNIAEAVMNKHLAGNGPFARRCADWLKAEIGSAAAFMVHSCTGALEMSALLANLGPGDEVIMPSFTFVSTANAVVLRGAVPVFVDIRPDTLNLDEEKVEAAITPKTRAMVVVHYAGVGCEMDRIVEICNRRGIILIEDAAQALLSTYRGRPLGSFGRLACLSFHETKNLISGEGGALMVNDPTLVKRAEIIHEKGTDRSAFFRGEVDRYTWREVGSSFPPSEIVTAFLAAQMEHARPITARRLELHARYHAGLAVLEERGLVRRPCVPDHCTHNAHIYHIRTCKPEDATALLSALQGSGIHAISHFVPLHQSPAGRVHARAHGGMTVTEEAAVTLVRLPLFYRMKDSDCDTVIRHVRHYFEKGA